MQALFRDIYAYHHHFNQQLISELGQHQSALPEKTYSLFCHILNAHQIWNARILGRPGVGVWEVHKWEQLSVIDIQNYETTRAIIEDGDLNRRITYFDTKGKSFENKVVDILFHVANHSTHHKGMIIQDFRSIGIAPLVTDYIFFKR